MTIPSSVTSIGEEAFCECRGLTSVIIPSSVTNIGEYAFFCCKGLTSVTIPSSMTSIGKGVFCGCSGLTSVTIPSSVTSIGKEAFYGCIGLENVVISDGVVSIESGAFFGCSGLTSVTIPSSVKSIGISAFRNCSGLTSATISEGVANIGECAFYECRGLTSVIIPSSVKTIGDSAFPSTLTTVYVGKGDTDHVKTLYDWPDNVAFIEFEPPAIVGDAGATVAGDPANGFVIRPSAGKTAVEVTIPQGVDAAKVTVEVPPTVNNVKTHGANIRIVKGVNDITRFLDVPAEDGNGVVDLARAMVKEEYVNETLNPTNGAVVILSGEAVSLTTADTRPRLSYTLHEGKTLDEMKAGDHTVGDGNPWSPEIKVKGGKSGFYSIKVEK